MIPPFAFRLVTAAVLALSHPAQEKPEDRLAKLIHDGTAMEDLAYLSDEIGARLTGSVACDKAQQWAMAKMKEYGAENVHREAYSFPSRWERGTEDRLTLLTQSGKEIGVHAMAWNPATKGAITADAMLLEGRVDELLKRVDDYKGKIVVLGAVRRPADGSDPDKLIHELNKKLGMLAVGLLAASGDESGKFIMYGSPYDWYLNDYFGGWPRLPFGFLTSEDFSLLKRLLTKGDKVRLRLNLGGKITKAPVEEHNVIGEIRGSGKPDEVVIIGGHLDSWDLGTGTTDNGTGSVATLQTLRAMNKLGIKPKRTIRFILFTGEEQGICGSTAYAKQHAAEMANIQAILIDDLGPGKPNGFTCQGYGQWVPLLKTAMEPLAGIGVQKILVKQHWDSDQDPFIEHGVPGFFMDQDITTYFGTTYHSQMDMFSHVKAEDYLPGIQAIATVGWGFANCADRLPHVPAGHVTGPDKG